MSRQIERRKLVEFAFSQVPLWETWSEQRNKLTDVEHFNAERDVGTELERETRTINHVKT